MVVAALTHSMLFLGGEEPHANFKNFQNLGMQAVCKVATLQLRLQYDANGVATHCNIFAMPSDFPIATTIATAKPAIFCTSIP